MPVRASHAATCELVALEPLSFGAIRVRLRFMDLSLSLRPGQFVDLRSHAGDSERLPVTGVSQGILEVESPDDGGALHQWLSEHAVAGSQLRVAGPFDAPR